MITLGKQHTGRRQAQDNTNPIKDCGDTVQLAKGKQFLFLIINIYKLVQQYLRYISYNVTVGCIYVGTEVFAI